METELNNGVQDSTNRQPKCNQTTNVHTVHCVAVCRRRAELIYFFLSCSVVVHQGEPIAPVIQPFISLHDQMGTNPARKVGANVTCMGVLRQPILLMLNEERAGKRRKMSSKSPKVYSAIVAESTAQHGGTTVSYTHLTLPTKRIV